jgi:Outer membrane lipoprotein-sorting protein
MKEKMMYKMMKSRRIPALLMAFALGVGALAPAMNASAAPTGDEIMQKVVGAMKIEGSEAIVEMSLGAEKRKLKMATKLVDGGKTEKRVYEFLEPADIRGSKALVFDHESSADDVWVFLPAVKRTATKIVSSDRGKSFMGSEFSYADLTVPDLKSYNYAVEKEEKVLGEDCFVVNVTPKDAATGKSEGYSKKTYWVSKATFTVRQGVFYDLSGKRVKRLQSSDIKSIAPKRYRAMKMEMVNEVNGKTSVFTTSQFQVNQNVKEDYFTTAYLERT